jgi:TRAP-type C4-dicarboxylate transport system substrate-binding protein
MKVGQRDAAMVTSDGLRLMVPEVNVLRAPGVISNSAQLETVTQAVLPDFDALFEKKDRGSMRRSIERGYTATSFTPEGGKAFSSVREPLTQRVYPAPLLARDRARCGSAETGAWKLSWSTS